MIIDVCSVWIRKDTFVPVLYLLSLVMPLLLDFLHFILSAFCRKLSVTSHTLIQ